MLSAREASELARQQLEAELPNRWRHVQAVARRAEEIRFVVEPDANILVTAAWLHDIGCAPPLRRTGLHQIDGAVYVQAIGGNRLTGLVAHHSEARFEAGVRGFGDALASYQREESPTADALTYRDLTTGPAGQRMTLDERLREVTQRYGAGELIEALNLATPYLAAAVDRTIERLRQHGSPVELRDDGL